MAGNYITLVSRVDGVGASPRLHAVDQSTAAMAAAIVSERPGRAVLRAGASLKARKVIDTGRTGSNQKIWIKWAAGAAR